MKHARPSKHARRRPISAPAALLAAGLAVAPLLGGCQAPPEEVPPPAPTAGEMQSLKRAFEAQAPGVVVGNVTEVLPDAPFAEVAGLPAGSVAEDDAVTFIDPDTNIVAQGTVVRVTPGAAGDVASVRFVPAEDPAARRPQAGDLALKYPE